MNTYTKSNSERLAQVAKCALADLEGIMPEFEASGDRQHPAWKTIKELKSALAQWSRDVHNERGTAIHAAIETN